MARKELDSATNRVYTELIVKSGDTNERVSDRAEEAIQAMLRSQRIRELGIVQERLLVPIKLAQSSSQSRRPGPGGGSGNAEKPEPPKQALTRCELVLFMIKDLDLAGRQFSSVSACCEFGVSALGHTAPGVRKQGEKILLALYAVDPDRVRRYMPDDGDRSKNLAFRKVLEEFDKRDAIGEARGNK